MDESVLKIAIAGYHYSGCGVIDDLFKEFDNVSQPIRECESRFLHEMDGVSDLEYHLVENPHRLKTSYAIDRFLRYCKREEKKYEKLYGSNWFLICKEYVEDLIKFQYKGYNLIHLSERSSFYPRYVKFQSLLQKLLPVKYRKSSRYNYFPKEKLYHASLSEEEFLEKTRVFTNRLVESMKVDRKADYVIMDQMFAANNPTRYLRYVDNVKGIVVDRDPRDLYINHQLREDHMLPPDPHQFCEHFRDIRKIIGGEDPNVLYLMIEDMIYHYDVFVPKVCEFVGIDRSHHVQPKKYFDPAISIKGTRTWERYPQFSEAVKTIEQELPDFLYKNY
ncbi:MAG: hypothetical protein IKQ09_01535 [Bacteroidales bacterium]|nr:hypothetical protein [Bacteroidales bacterium]